MKKDHFEIRSKEYDSTSYRLRYVDEMAQSIRQNVDLKKEMTLIDFGAGTGLLTERLAPYVGKIIAVDISDSMIEQLRQKQSRLPCTLELCQTDLTQKSYEGEKADGLVSTMTLHHIEDVPALFCKFYEMLKPGAFLACCDIDSEDGSFHTIDTGVRHHGFDREEILRWCLEAGFEEATISDSTVIHKPQGDYPAFLLTAKKPD